MIAATLRWRDTNVFSLGRETGLSYLPPLMVYVAYGISGLTGIVGTFFVKDYLGLSASFLAALGFWAGIPWALEMPLGHLVDLLWRWKSALVFVGASLIATSLGIMVGLLTDRAAMVAVMPAEAWFVLSALLSPVGYLIQDAVADAMTVEAVPAPLQSGDHLRRLVRHHRLPPALPRGAVAHRQRRLRRGIPDAARGLVVAGTRRTPAATACRRGGRCAIASLSGPRGGGAK